MILRIAAAIIQHNEIRRTALHSVQPNFSLLTSMSTTEPNTPTPSPSPSPFNSFPSVAIVAVREHGNDYAPAPAQPENKSNLIGFATLRTLSALAERHFADVLERMCAGPDWARNAHGPGLEPRCLVFAHQACLVRRCWSASHVPPRPGPGALLDLTRLSAIWFFFDSILTCHP